MTHPPMRSKEWIEHKYIPGKLYRINCQRSLFRNNLENDFSQYCLIPEGSVVMFVEAPSDSIGRLVIYKEYIGWVLECINLFEEAKE